MMEAIGHWLWQETNLLNQLEALRILQESVIPSDVEIRRRDLALWQVNVRSQLRMVQGQIARIQQGDDDGE